MAIFEALQANQHLMGQGVSTNRSRTVKVDLFQLLTLRACDNRSGSTARLSPLSV